MDMNINYDSNTYISYNFRVKDPISALTHFIAFVSAIFGMPILLTHGAMAGCDFLQLTSLSVFMLSMILLYGASTSYHSFDISESANRTLKKLDHSMISVLIAGSYTPVCLIALKGATGVVLLSFVWGLAIVGIVVKLCWIYCPKWFSSVIYIGLGWSCLFAFPQLHNTLSHRGFLLLLIGGLMYTTGGVIYALKLHCFDKYKNFGGHEIFHIFVMAGSFCHFLFMYQELIG